MRGEPVHLVPQVIVLILQLFHLGTVFLFGSAKKPPGSYQHNQKQKDY